MHASANTPAEPLGACRFFPNDDGLPRYQGGSASASFRFEACSTFTHVPACMLAESPYVTRFVEVLQQLCHLHHRSDCFRLERPVAGWDSHPLEVVAFSRRTLSGHYGIRGSPMCGVTEDLVQGDRKISGSCVYRSLGLVFYSATLLVDPDLDLVERYLTPPPRQPAYRRGRAHRDFMGRLVSPTTAYSAQTFEMAARVRLTVESLPALPS